MKAKIRCSTFHHKTKRLSPHACFTKTRQWWESVCCIEFSSWLFSRSHPLKRTQKQQSYCSENVASIFKLYEMHGMIIIKSQNYLHNCFENNIVRCWLPLAFYLDRLRCCCFRCSALHMPGYTLWCMPVAVNTCFWHRQQQQRLQPGLVGIMAWHWTRSTQTWEHSGTLTTLAQCFGCVQAHRENNLKMYLNDYKSAWQCVFWCDFMFEIVARSLHPDQLACRRNVFGPKPQSMFYPKIILSVCAPLPPFLCCTNLVEGMFFAPSEEFISVDQQVEKLQSARTSNNPGLEWVKVRADVGCEWRMQQGSGCSTFNLRDNNALNGSNSTSSSSNNI